MGSQSAAVSDLPHTPTHTCVSRLTIGHIDKRLTTDLASDRGGSEGV